MIRFQAAGWQWEGDRDLQVQPKFLLSTEQSLDFAILALSYTPELAS
ncbi:hypothetical protein [Vacuolonema iberomarrocanum]|nr:hypothetical protein [filamentous cyanobacterium LEGE 07170]